MWSIVRMRFLFQEFPRAHSLLRNMMGLLGNVAEVPNLRHKLMTQAFVTEFAMLLDSSLDGIEVSTLWFSWLLTHGLNSKISFSRVQETN